MAVSSRATSSGSNARMSTRRGRASSATAHPAPPAATATSTHPGFLTPGTLSRRRPPGPALLRPHPDPRGGPHPDPPVSGPPVGERSPPDQEDASGCPQPRPFEDNGGVLLD